MFIPPTHIPSQEDAATNLGFQCVQLLVSDYLPTLPKEHIPKTLDVVALFAQQVSDECPPCPPCLTRPERILPL